MKKRREGLDLPPGVDPAVIIRAIRFAAKAEGYRLSRGSLMDSKYNRSDRWYAIPASASYEEEEAIKQATLGYESLRAALRAVRKRNGEGRFGDN